MSTVYKSICMEVRKVMYSDVIFVKEYCDADGNPGLGGLTRSFHFGGTGNHQRKSIIMGGLPTPDETMIRELMEARLHNNSSKP